MKWEKVDGSVKKWKTPDGIVEVHVDYSGNCEIKVRGTTVATEKSAKAAKKKAEEFHAEEINNIYGGYGFI